MKANRLGRCIAFGNFELNPESGELLKLGSRVPRARPQEVHFLTLLIERAGTPVSKEDIHASLWPGEVPSKNRLNVVVSNARSALGDIDPKNRKYIASLGESGYCFVYPIDRITQPTGGYKKREAEGAYRTGLRAVENRKEASIREGVACFKRAIDSDPSDVRAWVQLSGAYIMLGIHCVDAPKDTFPKARAAAEEAAQINPSLPDILVTRACVLMCYERDWRSAEPMYYQALAKDPALPYAYNGLAMLLLATGRAQEGIASLEKACAANPLSAPLDAILCHFLCFARRYDEAVTVGKRAVRADPESCITQCCLGIALLYAEQYDEAILHLDLARSLSQESKIYLGFLGYAFAVAGMRKRAEEVLVRFLALPGHEYTPSYFVALIHYGLGRIAEACDWFDRACAERSHWVMFLGADPIFDGLRSYSRFQELVARMGFINGNSQATL